RYWSYVPPEGVADVNPLPAIDAGHVTFGCLNGFSKVNLAVLRLWSKVLAEAPDSRLLLYLRGGPGGEGRELQIFGDAGIDPARLETVGASNRREYVRNYHRIDVALDPFPYSGGVSTMDALWMGVPVLTLPGVTSVSRSTAAILSHAGLNEWIAGSEGQ